VQKGLESEDNERAVFLVVQYKGNKMMSRSVAQMVSANTTQYEVEY
jgi:hypothetical protein